VVNAVAAARRSTPSRAAATREHHPGEKRLVAFAKNFCIKLPAEMQERVEQMICALNHPEIVLPSTTKLIEGLEALLNAEKLL